MFSAPKRAQEKVMFNIIPFSSVFFKRMFKKARPPAYFRRMPRPFRRSAASRNDRIRLNSPFYHSSKIVLGAKGLTWAQGYGIIDKRLSRIYSAHPHKLHIAEWSSLAARRAHNPKVVGSNPASATNKNTLKSVDFEVFFYYYELFEGNSRGSKTLKPTY